MATKIPVTVTYHPTAQPGEQLTVDHSTVTLEFPDDWVEWELDATSLPSTAFLMIRFDQPLGPFQVVRGTAPHFIIAKGNKGDNPAVSYPYTLYLMTDVDGNLASGGPFTIENQCPNLFRSPWATVTFTPPSPGSGQGSAIVDPPTLLLHEGDTVLVELVDVPEDHVAAFWFPVDNSTQGPFSSNFVTGFDGAGIVATRPDGTRIVRLPGGTFGPSTSPTISYGVRIWNADGVLVASHDPSIDNLGRPPGT